MTKEELKVQKRRLMEIYREHSIPEFRTFIKEQAPNDKRYVPLVEADDEKLSLLMYVMKSRLLYLGDAFQEARNVLRARQFWHKTDKLSKIRSVIQSMPNCQGCKYFMEPIPPAMKPCMHLGAMPTDICCPTYKAISPN
jgi:hypothetical protein